MELLYSSGVRLGELVRLDVTDVDLRAGVAVVREGKGGHGRVAPVGREARRALEVWLAVRRGVVGMRPLAALFVSRRLTRLAARSVQQLLGRRQRGLPMRLSAHGFRHSCASHFLQSSGDLRATQELLGHRNIASTQIYTRLDYQHLAGVYDRAHPRARKGR